MAKMDYEQAWKELKRQLIEQRFGIAYNDGLKYQDNLYLYRYYGNVIDMMDAAENHFIEEHLEEVIEELPNIRGIVRTITKADFTDVEISAPPFPSLCLDLGEHIFMPTMILSTFSEHGDPIYDGTDFRGIERRIIGFIPIEEGDNDG